MKIRRVVVKVFQSSDATTDAIYTFSYPEAKIDFMVSQTDTQQPDNCYVKLYGVSKETYARFDKNKTKLYSDAQIVEIYYGYDEDLSLVFNGTIDRVTYSFSGGAQILTMLLTKGAKKFMNMKKSISMNGKQSIKRCVEEICKAYEYTPRFSTEGNFDSIEVGRFVYSGTIKDALMEVLPDGYNYYVDDKIVHIYESNKSTIREVKLFMHNGLLEYPTEDTKGEKTTIKSILIPMVESGMKINVPVDDVWFSESDTGTYRTYVVGNYVSSFSGGIGTSEFECSVEEVGSGNK